MLIQSHDGSIFVLPASPDIWKNGSIKGIRVRTLTALITDLGTVFGVIAHSDGSTEAHILKGRISIALDPNRSGRLNLADIVGGGNGHGTGTLDQGIDLSERVFLFVVFMVLPPGKSA